MKQFVKALNKENNCFRYLCASFPELTMEKLKASIFDGLQIRKMLKDTHFTDSMSAIEKKAWLAFIEVTRNFLGNHKSENYRDLVNNMLKAFHKLGCNVSIKVHYFFSHLDWFPENLGHVSEEQGERFHQDLKIMEERYQGRWDVNMMADYCWNLKRDLPYVTHARKAKKKRFLAVQ